MLKMTAEELEAYINAQVEAELAKENGTFQEDKSGNVKTEEEKAQEAYEEARDRVKRLKAQHHIR
jgi:hypothetical protein